MKKITVSLSGSKSITNRLLVLNALFDNAIQLKNISQSQDTSVIIKALSSQGKEIDIHHAGTAMRFLTAYFSIQDGRETVLTGSSRMKERPIRILVDALRSLGADIQYFEQEGFPPLQIKGKKLEQNQVKLLSNVSSQYITALCLIGAKLPQGLSVILEGKLTSFPYIKMTLQILKKMGIETEFENNTITIHHCQDIKKQQVTVESDWSSASYHYSICALGNYEIEIQYLFEDSLQGDKRVSDIYGKYFGVETSFDGGKLTLKKNTDFRCPKFIELDMNDCPDIAQTVSATALGLQIPMKITGLETLKIKETDRLQALKNELEKLGGGVEITDSSIELKSFAKKTENIVIETYNDHRMAMSFAPLKLLFPFEIENPEVVEKSYAEFWDDMKKYEISAK